MTRSEQKVYVRRLFRSKASGHCYGLAVEGFGGFGDDRDLFDRHLHFRDLANRHSDHRSRRSDRR